MSDLGDRFRITVNEIDVVEPDHALPQLPVACAVWKPRPSLETSAEAWLMAGGPHHTVLTKALPLGSVEDLATMVGVELVVIDADTTDRRRSPASCAGTPPTTGSPPGSEGCTTRVPTGACDG